MARDGTQARVLKMHTVKPLDRDAVSRCAMETGALVTVEEHSVIGGLGGAVAEALVEGEPVPVERVDLIRQESATADKAGDYRR